MDDLLAKVQEAHEEEKKREHEKLRLARERHMAVQEMEHGVRAMKVNPIWLYSICCLLFSFTHLQ